jgi:hypothetical protein
MENPMTEHDYISSAASRLHNMVLPSAGDIGSVALMAEAAKIEALIAIAQELRKLNKNGVAIKA